MIIENYTTTLYNLINNFYTRPQIESWFKDYELTDYLTSEQILSITTHGVWSKDKLASKIVDHYLMSQIGFETPALFKHYVKIHMKEIMEKYLPLIYSSSIEYDPLVNVDYTETFERNIGEDTSGTHTNQGTIQEEKDESNSGTIHDEKNESNSNQETFQNTKTDNITNTNSTSGTSTSSSSNSGNSLNIGSDTPMTNINKTDILARKLCVYYFCK